MSEQDTATPLEISKKELLQETGISYGQLYRWKREGLIPEEWFSKRSAFTGQETYFPRKLVLERVEAIQSMKDGLSLSDIRDLLNAKSQQANLQTALVVTGCMSEEFIDSLPLDKHTMWLSDLSTKAITSLYLALGKSEASEAAQKHLLVLVIRALALTVPATSPAEECCVEEASAQTEGHSADADVDTEADEQADSDKPAASDKDTEEEG